jgi:hypothetical protein
MVPAYIKVTERFSMSVAPHCQLPSMATISQGAAPSSKSLEARHHKWQKRNKTELIISPQFTQRIVWHSNTLARVAVFEVAFVNLDLEDGCCVWEITPSCWKLRQATKTGLHSDWPPRNRCFFTDFFSLHHTHPIASSSFHGLEFRHH